MRVVPGAGAGLLADRDHPNVAHKRADAAPPDAVEVAPWQPAQHPRAGEGEGQVQVQEVDPSHEREIAWRRRARRVARCTAADPQRGSCPVMESGWVRSIIAWHSSGGPCRARGRKHQFPSRARRSSRGGSSLRPGATGPSPATPAAPEGGDLAGMDFEPLGQLGARAFVSNGGQGDPCLEDRGVIARGPFRHRGLLGCGEHSVGLARGPLTILFEKPRPLQPLDDPVASVAELPSPLLASGRLAPSRIAPRPTASALLLLLLCVATCGPERPEAPRQLVNDHDNRYRDCQPPRRIVVGIQHAPLR